MLFKFSKKTIIIIGACISGIVLCVLLATISGKNEGIKIDESAAKKNIEHVHEKKCDANSSNVFQNLIRQPSLQMEARNENKLKNNENKNVFSRSSIPTQEMNSKSEYLPSKSDLNDDEKIMVGEEHVGLWEETNIANFYNYPHEIINRNDLNKDGVVSIDEFIGSESLFNELDSDSDNEISLDEINLSFEEFLSKIRAANEENSGE